MEKPRTNLKAKLTEDDHNPPKHKKAGQDTQENLPENFSRTNLKNFYKKLGRLNGIKKPNSEEELPLTHQIYLKALKDITYTMLIYTLIMAIPIYFTAITHFGFAFTEEKPLYRILDLITKPNAFISRSKVFDFVEHTLNPLGAILVISILCYRFAKVKQSFIDRFEEKGLYENFDFLKNFHLQGIKFETQEQIEIFFCQFLDMEVKRKCVIYVDTMGLEMKWKELKEVKFQIEELRAKNIEICEEVRQREIDLNQDFHDCLRNLKGDQSIFQAPVSIIMFQNFKEAKNFLTEFKEWMDSGKHTRNPKTRNVKIEAGPNPHDIIWSQFGNTKSIFTKTTHMLFFFIFIVLGPCLTYFLQYSLHVMIADAFFSPKSKTHVIQDITKLIFYENAYFFMFFRLTVTFVYNLILTYYIEEFYLNGIFRMEHLRQKSKFYFFNFFYLTNFIIADFYAILMSSLENGVDKDKKIEDLKLDINSSFLYTSALKVALSLIFSPYTQKFVEFYLPIFLPKVKEKLLGKRRLLESERMKLEYDRSLHSMGSVGSFFVQGVFYISFIQSFIMPFINIIVVIGMFLFLKFERYTLLNKHTVHCWINVDAVLMMYRSAIFGFLVIKFFGLGNSVLVLNYMSNVNLQTLYNLIFSIFDYSINLILLIAVYLICSRYSSAKVTKSLRERFFLKENDEFMKAVEDLRRSANGDFLKGDSIEEAEDRIYGNLSRDMFNEAYPLYRLKRGELKIE